MTDKRKPPIPISDFIKTPEAARVSSVTTVTRCPACNQKLWEKESPCSGFLSVKCPRCKHRVMINLALRRAGGG